MSYTIIDCDCATWTLSSEDEWEAITSGKHHLSCPKSLNYQLKMIKIYCETELSRPVPSRYAESLAKDILEIIGGE